MIVMAGTIFSGDLLCWSNHRDFFSTTFQDLYTVVRNDTAEMYDDDAHGNGEVLATYESDDLKLKAGILSTNLQITKFEENNIMLKMMGVFNEKTIILSH